MTRKWTEEEKKAFGEKMKAAREAKKKEAPEEKKADIVQDDTITLLLKRIEELEQRQFFTQPIAAPTLPKHVITKYSFNPKDYADPCERLASEPRLERFGFKFNNALQFKVEKVQYEEEGQKYTAPRFVLKLLGRIFDEETNEPKTTTDPKTGETIDSYYVMRQAMFFEDPDSFIAIANQHGIEIPEDLTQAFLDEMRYMSMRDWLFERFYPTPAQKPDYVREEVIGNRLVPIVEISSTDAKDMDSLMQKI